MAPRGIFLDDCRLPACRSTINQACSHDHTGCGVLPDRARRLDYQAGVETGLLVTRWSIVIVCKHCAKRAVYLVVVENIIGEPALYCRLRAERSEERVCFCFRTRKRAVAWITRVG